MASSNSMTKLELPRQNKEMIIKQDVCRLLVFQRSLLTNYGMRKTKGQVCSLTKIKKNDVRILQRNSESSVNSING